MLAASAVLVSCGPKPEDGSNVVDFHSADAAGTEYKPSANDSYVRQGGTRSTTDKPTALVYYAVDTEEPFMQAAVDYEIRALRSTCTRDAAKINWIAFVNSHYVNRGRAYLLCKNGVLSEKKLADEVEKIVDIVASPDYDPSRPAARGLTIPLRHPRELAPLFRKYPLSHPEVLSALLKKTGKDHFPTSEFSLTLHLKSHGSDELLLSGLTAEQLNKKSTRQETVLHKHLQEERDRVRNSSKDIDFRNRVSCEANGGDWTGRACFCEPRKIYINQFFGECTRSIGRAGLGSLKNGEIGMDVTGLGRSRTAFEIGSLGERYLGENYMGEAFMGESYMGENYMGEAFMGERFLGERFMGERFMGYDTVGSDGLGVAGLGATAHFGTTHEAMSLVLQDVKSDIAFVVFESCQSKVSANSRLKTALEADGSKVNGYYSADGSLWYRNYDWEIILRTVQRDGVDQSKTMTEMLSKWSNKVTTYKAVQAQPGT